jgi:hypothetical protein
MSGRWLAGLLVGTLAGCGGPATVTVQAAAGSAGVAKGDVLVVDLGKENPSIGDSWYLQTPPDAAVLTDNGGVSAGCNLPGCDRTLTWKFTAVGKGSTAIVFRYCYRSRLDNCDPGPGRGPKEPVRLSVTVH